MTPRFLEKIQYSCDACAGYVLHPLTFWLPSLRSGSPFILVMEATKNWEDNDVLAVATPRIGKLFTCWNSLVGTLMRPRAVEIRHILAQDTPQLSLADDHDVVETFTPDAAKQSLTDGIRSWCFDRRSQYLDPAAQRDSLEVLTILRVIIPDQVVGRLAEGCRRTQLLSNPLVTRRPCHADMHDPSRAQFHDDKGTQRPKEDIRELQEVAGPAVIGVILEEGCPRLTMPSWWPDVTHGALNGPLRDRDPNFQQLTANAFGAPQPVVGCHLFDQDDRLGWDLRCP